MNLTEMRSIVRRDLHDEDATNYRWSDDEIARHITHAVRELSEAIPHEQRATLATTTGSREIDISSLTNRVMVQAVEYPAGRFPRSHQRFSLWVDSICLLGDEVPDGSDAYIYYGKLHTLDESSSTVPSHLEDVIAGGACGHAAMEWATFAINRVNIGGDTTTREFQSWGKEKLRYFRGELRRLGRRNRARLSQLYQPARSVKSKTADYGP